MYDSATISAFENTMAHMADPLAALSQVRTGSGRRLAMGVGGKDGVVECRACIPGFLVGRARACHVMGVRPVMLG